MDKDILLCKGERNIISSHILPELAEMVDEIGVIEQGRLLAQGKVQDIQGRMRANRVLHIRMLDKETEAAERLKDEPFVTLVLCDEQGIHVHFGGEDADQFTLLQRLIAGGYRVIRFGEEETDLEDVFLEITKGVQA